MNPFLMILIIITSVPLGVYILIKMEDLFHQDESRFYNILIAVLFIILIIGAIWWEIVN